MACRAFHAAMISYLHHTLSEHHQHDCTAAKAINIMYPLIYNLVLFRLIHY